MKKEFELPEARVMLVPGMSLFSNEPITSPKDAVLIMAEEMKKYDREVLFAINLDIANHPINYTMVSMGILNGSLVHPREVMKTAILSNAASIILLHNHPSGGLNPSKVDIEITDRMSKACQICGINLLEHIITAAGTNEFFSFYTNKMIKQGDIYYKTELDEGSILKNS